MVSKKKNPSFVWGCDRKSRPSWSPFVITGQALWCESVILRMDFSIPPSHSRARSSLVIQPCLSIYLTANGSQLKGLSLKTLRHKWQACQNAKKPKTINRSRFFHHRCVRKHERLRINASEKLAPPSFVWKCSKIARVEYFCKGPVMSFVYTFAANQRLCFEIRCMDSKIHLLA